MKLDRKGEKPNFNQALHALNFPPMLIVIHHLNPLCFVYLIWKSNLRFDSPVQRYRGFCRVYDNNGLTSCLVTLTINLALIGF